MATDALRFGEDIAELSTISMNHRARMCGLALLDAENRTRLFRDVGIIAMAFMGEGDANFSLHFRHEDTNVTLDAGGSWDPKWSFDPSTRIVVAALDERKVVDCSSELLRLGRAVTFREPCATYELPAQDWDALCCGGSNGSYTSGANAGGDTGALLESWVRSKDLDCAAVSAAYGLPPGYLLRTLRLEDAECVDAAWKYRTTRSVDMMRLSIATRPTAGLQDEHGNLISWILVRSDGSMGVLHTLPKHRGKGRARQVVKFVSLQLRRWQYALQIASQCSPNDAQVVLAARLAAQIVPYCHIKLGNAPSESLFKGLGFVEVNRVTWVISAALAPRVRLRPLNLSLEHEMQDMLALINTSYRQDDAFFVNQTRTDEATLRGMCLTGVFFVGYAMDVSHPDATIDGTSTRSSSAVLGCRHWVGQAHAPFEACSAHPAELFGASRDLLVCVYISVSDEAVGDVAGAGKGDVKPFPSLGGARIAADVQHVPASAPPAGPVHRVSHLSMLTIKPSLKRSGMGQRVLDFALETSAQWGADAVDAYVVSVKPWLLSFYTDKNGFRVVGSEPWPAELNHQLVLPTFFRKVRKTIAPAV